jgi:deazaflavin-dependent oxidoreductase (nitroreductase family)
MTTTTRQIVRASDGFPSPDVSQLTERRFPPQSDLKARSQVSSRSTQTSRRTERSEEIVDNPDGWVTEHIREYVATDGRRGHRLSGWKDPTLLLVTRGRRSGKLRRTALAYGEHDGRYVIAASNGGARRHPDWYLNLVEDPAVQVQVGDDKFAARARDARAEERPALWRLMTSTGPALDDFQRKSGREIPIVILERTGRRTP